MSKDENGVARDNIINFAQKSGTKDEKATDKQKPTYSLEDVSTAFDNIHSNLDVKISKLEQEIENLSHSIEQGVGSALERAGLKNQKEQLEKDLQNIVSGFEERINEILNRSITPPQKDKKRAETVVAIGAQLLFNLTRLFDKNFYKNFLWARPAVPIEVDEFGMDLAFEEKLAPLYQFLYNTYWRVQTKGLANIPNKGRAIIVSNHSGMLPFDGSMIKAAVRIDHPSQRELRFLVENFVYHFPFLGTFMARIGGVRACQENAERLLQKDQIISVFPEGIKGLGKTFKHRYRLQRFGRGGFIKLALKTGAPIIPTAVMGAEEIYPIIARADFLARPLGIPFFPITPIFPWLGPLGLIPLPTKWKIWFGEPIRLDSYGPEAINDELLVNRLSNQTKEIIQQMIMDMLRTRASVWF